MSFPSRARSRVLTLLVTVPLLVGGAPFVSPALAVDAVRVATLVETQGALRIGPTAGFRGDVSRGVEGHTALVAISAGTSDVINSVKITVAEDAPFAYANDFDSADGFALYKDLDDNDRLDPADYAAGAVSQSNPSVTVSGGTLTVTVTGDPFKATGQDNYLLAVHPRVGATGERIVHFTIPAAGVSTSAGTMPASTLTLPNILLDAQAPAQIPAANYTPVSRPPAAGGTCPDPAPATGCGDDYYLVYRSAPAETGDNLAFYNNGTTLTDSALLQVPSGNTTAPAQYETPTISDNPNSKTQLSIGNGTGRIATDSSSKALNNQITDEVFAVQWDGIGNLVTLKLTNVPCTPLPCDTTPRGNDVTAPNLTWTVTMGTINSGTNLQAVPVTATLTGNDASTPTTTQTPISLLAKPQRVQQVPGSNPPVYTVISEGTEKRSATPGTPGSATPNPSPVNVDVSNNTTFPQGEYIWGAARLVDATGNATLVKNTGVVLKDTLAPSFVRVSLLDLNHDGNADEGDKFRVEFDDSMDKTKIANATLATRLTMTDSAGDPCTDPGDGLTTPCGVVWGAGATVEWSVDGRLLTVTLGAPCTDILPPDCLKKTRLPQAGDKITADTNVTDRAGNVVANRTAFTISAPTVMQVEARTVDTLGLGTAVWNTNRDGVLDAIDVQFSGDVDANSVNNTSLHGLWEVSWIGTTIVPVATRTSPDIVHLAFTVPIAARSQWGTGATPLVSLHLNDQNQTELLTATAQPIQAFNLTSTDKVGPVPVAVTTGDTTTVNGKIDTVLVKFSEGVDVTQLNDCGWLVTGYADPNYKPAGFPTASNCAGGANGFAAGTSNDTIKLTLGEGSFDTGATPLVSYSATRAIPSYAPNTTTEPSCENVNPITGAASPDCPILDVSGTGLASFSGNAADKAGPFITARGTQDADTDGRIDRIKVTFSEAVDSLSVGAALFQVTEPTTTVLPTTIISSTEIGVTLQQGPPFVGDTSVRPKLKFLGGTTDVVNPPNSSSADANPVQVDDKAGPAIIGACASSPTGTNGTMCPVDDAANDKVTVLLSEVIDATTVQTVTPWTDDFVVEQPAGTLKAITGVAVEADNKRVTLTFAQGAIDSNAATGVVRFKAAAVVKDNATVKNDNTQTTNRQIFPIPTVTMDLTCPNAANPGYCDAAYVNTNAGGTPGVSLWRLATTARATTPPDSEFSSNLPSRYPDSGVLPEGILTLYLSGKDAFGRLSPEFSDSIRILKAPKINNVQFVDSRIAKSGTWPTTQTVLDGDNVQIGADAQGSDSLEWAANSAPVGGGCLAQYMQADLRALSGISSQSAVAPITCNYTTSTSPPSRQMRFPVVTATKTTKFPVGVVLRVAGTSTADPGYLIQDLSNGTQVRRHFITANARRSWQIPDSMVIAVPKAVLTGIPTAPNVAYRDGSIIRGSGTSTYYYVIVGHKKPVSTGTLAALKIPLSTAYVVTTSELRAMPTTAGIGAGAHKPGMFIKFSNGTIQEVVRKAGGATVRRSVTSWTALKTQVATNRIYPANAQDSALPVDTWMIGYRDGTLLKTATGYAVVARGALRSFANSSTFNTLGYSTSYALSFCATCMPHVKNQSYRTGAAIDRYKIMTVKIKVTNKAGASVTAIVLPSVPGIYGVGTLDPVPVGWDFSRNWPI